MFWFLLLAGGAAAAGVAAAGVVTVGAAAAAAGAGALLVLAASWTWVNLRQVIHDWAQSLGDVAYQVFMTLDPIVSKPDEWRIRLLGQRKLKEGREEVREIDVHSLDELAPETRDVLAAEVAAHPRRKHHNVDVSPHVLTLES